MNAILARVFKLGLRNSREAKPELKNSKGTLQGMPELRGSSFFEFMSFGFTDGAQNFLVGTRKGETVELLWREPLPGDFSRGLRKLRTPRL